VVLSVAGVDAGLEALAATDAAAEKDDRGSAWQWAAQGSPLQVMAYVLEARLTVAWRLQQPVRHHTPRAWSNACC
jgi:hypothetical protein